MPDNKSAGTNEVLGHGRKDYVYDGTNWRPALASTSGATILGAGTAAAATVAVSNIETIQTELRSAGSLAASTVVLSSTLSVVGAKRATVFIDHGRAATANFGVNGTEYLIQASEQAANNDTWRTLASVLCASTACSSIRFSPAIAAADTSVTVVSTTTMAVGDLYVVANTASAASIEWGRVATVTGTASFTSLDAFRYAAASTNVIYNQAEHFAISLNIEGVTRIRAVINNNASGTTYAIYNRIAMITAQ